MSDKFGLRQILERFEQMKKDLPVQLANVTQNHFAEAFQKQGWDGQPWQEVNRRIPGTPEYKYPLTKGLSRRTKPILVQTGKLRRAVGMSVRTVSFERITLIVALPYASYINDGTTKMVARKFFGQSNELTRLQTDKVKQALTTVFKQ